MATLPQTWAFECFRRAGVQTTLSRDFLLVLGGSWLVALLAQISIPLGFTPVPISGQTLGVLLVGASLGSQRGALAMILYLVQGAIGLPFLADGESGITIMMGSTSGYLLGFVAACFAVGHLCEKGWDRSLLGSLGAFTIGHILIFGFGLLGLSFFVGREQVLALGLMPFLPGMVIKTALAGAMMPTLWKALGKWPSAQ